MKIWGFVREISEMFRDMSQVPEWLKSALPVQKQMRVIRQALGMTQQQLAARIGVRQNAVAKIENQNGDIRLSTVKKIAEALECEILVQFVPKRAIVDLLEQEAEKMAERMTDLSAGNMALEMQLPDRAHIDEGIRELKTMILNQQRSALWERKKKRK